MNVFAVGDVHGCYHTLLEVLQHWRPTEELLVQTGDLVDRGRYAPECVELARELEGYYPGRTVFLLGNHEYEMQLHYGPQGPNPNWLRWGGRATVQQYLGRPELLEQHLSWLAGRPLFWENDHLLLSHAGFASTEAPLDLENPNGVLWRRGPLLNVGKRQVIGHTPTDGQLAFDPAANAVCIDTGAYLGQCLAGVRFSATGEVLEEVLVPTHATDLL